MGMPRQNLWCKCGGTKVLLRDIFDVPNVPMCQCGRAGFYITLRSWTAQKAVSPSFLGLAVFSPRDAHKDADFLGVLGGF